MRLRKNVSEELALLYLTNRAIYAYLIGLESCFSINTPTKTYKDIQASFALIQSAVKISIEIVMHIS